MAMLKAIWKDCPGLREGRHAHSMRDHCWSCAPFWERYPTCPHCGLKLEKTGRTRCKGCQKYVLVEKETTPFVPTCHVCREEKPIQAKVPQEGTTGVALCADCMPIVFNLLWGSKTELGKSDILHMARNAVEVLGGPKNYPPKGG